MDDCVRIPSSVIADIHHDEVSNYNNNNTMIMRRSQRGDSGGANNHNSNGMLMMTMNQYPNNFHHQHPDGHRLENAGNYTNPPMLIHTVPSYVSTRSLSNRSISGRSVSGRSVVTSATSRSRVSHHPNADTAQQGAERIAIATAQARAAAQSILLTGGTQASALSTARAAAQAALDQPHMSNKSTNQLHVARTSKPPLLRNNRRKNRQQAEIIASMALVSANEAVGLSYHQSNNNDMMSMAMSPASRYYNDTNSEYQDDHNTNYRSTSLAPSSYGRSQSIRSYNDLQGREYNERPNNPNTSSNSTKQLKPMILGPMGVLQSLTASPNTKMIQDQQQSTIPVNSTTTAKLKHLGNGNSDRSEQQATITSDAMKLLIKNPSLKDLFRTNKTDKESGALPKSKIPAEMPMPISIKQSVSLKGSNSGKKSKRASTTPRSRQRQLSGSQASCYSDASSYVSQSYTAGSTTYNDEQTADYTKETLESIGTIPQNKRNNFADNGSIGNNTFFSQFDPFVTTFSEVFSCNPGPAQHVAKYNQDKNINPTYSKSRIKRQESRDVSVNVSSYDKNDNSYNKSNIHIKEDERDPPPFQQQLQKQLQQQQVMKTSTTKNILQLTTSKSNNIATKYSNSVGLSTSSGNDDSVIDRTIDPKVQRGKKNKNYKDLASKPQKKKVTSPTMEQLVLRALSAISPKGGGGANSRRPRLNMIPLKANAGPTIKNDSYRSINDTSKVNNNGNKNQNTTSRRNNASKTDTADMVIVDTKDAIVPKRRHSGFEWNTSSSGSNDQPRIATGSDGTGSNEYRYNSHSDSDISAQQQQESSKMVITSLEGQSNHPSSTAQHYAPPSPATTNRGKRFSSLFQRSTKQY